MTTTTTTLRNQVDLDRVGQLVAKVSEDIEAAHTTWRADVTWTGGFRAQANIRNFAPTLSDEPVGLGGTDTAANPVEQLLAALGNCLAVGYAVNATVRGVTIERLSIAVSGNLDLRSFLGLEPGHAGFSDITAEVDFVTDADASTVAEIHAAVAATSPVGHTLSAAIPVSIKPAS